MNLTALFPLIDSACAALAAFILGVVFPLSGMGEPARIAAVLGAFLVFSVIMSGFKRPLHGFLPPLIGVGAPKTSHRFRLRYLAANFHAPLLVAVIGLFSLLDSGTRPVQEQYPIVRGTIFVVAKYNGKIVQNNRRVSRAETAEYKLLLHTLVKIKQTVTEMAVDSAKVDIAGRKRDEMSRFFEALGKFSFQDAYQAIFQRVKYSGKPPIVLLDLRLTLYSAAPLGSGDLVLKRDNDSYRKPPEIRVKGSFKEPRDRILTLREEFFEEDVRLLSIPRAMFSGTRPDSFNFLRHFYGWKIFPYVFPKGSREETRQSGGLRAPESKPALIWISDDSFEEARLQSYADLSRFSADIRDDPAMSDPALMEYKMFGEFFGPRLLVYIQGLQDMEPPQNRGMTILENLAAERNFRGAILKLPPIAYDDDKKYAGDFGKAVDSLHEGLDPFIKSLAEQGVDIDYGIIEKAGRRFPYDEIAGLVVVPYALWLLLLSLRNLLFRKMED